MLQHARSGVCRAPKSPEHTGRGTGPEREGGDGGGAGHTPGKGKARARRGAGAGPYQASRAFLVSGQAQQGFSGFFASPASLPSQLAAATEDMAGGSRCLSPRGEPAGGARESAAGSGTAHRPFPARRLPGARPPPPPPRLFLPALPLRGGAKVTISRDTQCYTGQQGKEGAGGKMAPSGESSGHAPQAARAASDALGSHSAESCVQPPKPPFFLLCQWGKRHQFFVGWPHGYSTVTITRNIHVAVSWQRPSRAGPWHCCKRMCSDARSFMLSSLSNKKGYLACETESN